MRAGFSRAAVVFVLTTALAACGGAYADAIARGDRFAEAGLYDKAAAEYEAAVKLRPDDPEAQIKLQEARRRQSRERLARGRALLARGEIAAGLAATQEAARLDPESAEVQRALTDANDKALARAGELLSGDLGKKALELTTLVLKGSPSDPRAKALDGRVRDRLAEEAYLRADAFAAKKKPGNALVELAACVSYRPGYRDAKLKLAEVQRALERELTFYVVLDRFTDGGGGRDLVSSLTPELLGQAFDERLPVRIVASAPTGAPELRGVHVWGSFEGYRFQHDQRKVGRTCDYVCGTDTKPNPDRDRLEKSVADYERRLASAEDDVARAQQDVDRQQKDVDRVRKDVADAEQALDRARGDLDRCRGSHAGDSNACSSEDSRVRSAQSSLDSARSRASSPESSLSSARDRLSSATDRRNESRRQKESETEQLRRTPAMIEVPRHCAFDYGVDVHTISARVTVKLSAEGLLDRSRLLRDEPFEYRVEQRDETFEAQRGRCAEVASGDPLVLLPEKDAKVRLVAQTIAGVREKVLGTFERYRERFLADARREEAAGLTDEAVEAYVRYLLTGPGKLDAKSGAAIGAFLERARGFGRIGDLSGM